VLDTDEDCTYEVLGALAVGAKVQEGCVLTYEFRGTGPFKMLSENWPPKATDGDEATIIRPMSEQVVQAISHPADEDVTDIFVEFSGPRGTDAIPPRVAAKYGWSSLTVTFCDGHESEVIISDPCV
jgi:hypothetical protein